MAYIPRLLGDLLEKTLKKRPLVYVNGARQCGKSTLVQNIFAKEESHYSTFDNPAILSFAKNDPIGFIQQLPLDKLNIIDEVQLAPELFRFLKINIDENRLSGKNQAMYVLTGSANIFALPQLANALVGRMSILTLYPFAVSEIKGTGINFLEKLYSNDLKPHKYAPLNIVNIISNATFPEIALDSKKDRHIWFNDYITTLLQRDVRSIGEIKNPDYIYQLLVSFSQRAGSLINNANIMKETGLDAKTYEKYKALCHSVFLTFELPSWTKPNKLNKRFVKQKKLYFTDTSLLCHIMQRDMEDLNKNDKTAMGHIFENFIATEIMKSAQSTGLFKVSHFNPVQNQGKEVDFVIESLDGKTIGIEVKLDGTIKTNDTVNMHTLQETVGSKFIKGIIIYTGHELMQISRNIWAVPVHYLFQDC